MTELQMVNKPETSLAPMTANEVINQVRLIQEVMRAAMKREEHYGVVPGCGDKPTLLKPGAEKLCLTFRMAPEFDILETDLPNFHKSYRVTSRLLSISSGRFLGSGVGVASTMESKYRYRSENTGKPVPSEYWEKRKPELLGGAQFSARKIGQQWMIVHKVEHDNPADFYNTVLKIAKKRAQVDAVLTATAASDIFAQDLEDLPHVPEQKTEPRNVTPQPAAQTRPPTTVADEIPMGEPTAPEKKPLTPPKGIKEIWPETTFTQTTEVMFGVIVNVHDPKPGKSGKNGPYKIDVQVDDQVVVVDTFDTNLAALAQGFGAGGEQHEIAFDNVVSGQYHNRKLLGLR